MAKSNLLVEDYAGVAGVTFNDSSLLDSAMIDQIGRGLPSIRRCMSEVTNQPAHFGTSQSDFLVVLPSRLAARANDEGGN